MHAHRAVVYGTLVWAGIDPYLCLIDLAPPAWFHALRDCETMAPPPINQERRRFLERVAMTMGAARAGMFSRLRSPEEGFVEATLRAPRELTAIGNAAEWINSPRLKADTLLGKVIAVDFWTYTCINWLRTLPYVRAWSQKYQQGLIVIGVHTPEFAFEHDLDNVRRAVRQMRVDFPVVIDNDYSIWRAFNNQYWPALYFVDAQGRVRQHQFGEGAYDTSER